MNKKNISIFLPENHLITLDILIQNEYIKSRSDGVRKAIQYFLNKLENNTTIMEEFIQRRLSQ